MKIWENDKIGMFSQSITQHFRFDVFFSVLLNNESPVLLMTHTVLAEPDVKKSPRDGVQVARLKYFSTVYKKYINIY